MVVDYAAKAAKLQESQRKSVNVSSDLVNKYVSKATQLKNEQAAYNSHNQISTEKKLQIDIDNIDSQIRQAENRRKVVASPITSTIQYDSNGKAVGVTRPTLNLQQQQEVERKVSEVNGEIDKLKTQRQQLLDQQEYYSIAKEAAEGGAGKLAATEQTDLNRNYLETTADNFGSMVAMNFGNLPGFALRAVLNAFGQDQAKYATADELRIYAYYKTRSEDKSLTEAQRADASAKAARFRELLLPSLNARKAQAEGAAIEDWADENIVTRVLAGAGAAASGLVGGFDDAVNTVKTNISNAVTGKYDTVDPYASDLSRYSDALTSGATKDLPEGWKFLAETGISIAQNAPFAVATILSGGTLAPVGLAVMSISAAGQAARDATLRGATAREALAIGVMAGAVEAITEKIPLDNLADLIKTGGRIAGKKIVVETLKQAGIEAGEEFISEIVNTVADVGVMGENSEFEQLRQELIGQGKTESEATAQAFAEFAVRALQAGLGGAISGGLMGGVGVISSNIKTGNYGKNFDSSARQSLVDFAKDSGDKELQDIAKAIGDPGKMSNSQAGDLAIAIANSKIEGAANFVDTAYLRSKERAKISETFKNKAKTAYEAGDALSDKVSSEMQNTANLGEISGSFRDLASNPKYKEITAKESAKQAGFSDAVADDLQRFSDKTGRRVVVVSEYAGNVDGMYDAETNTIYVSGNISENDVLRTVLKHELTHSLEGTQEYDRLTRYVERNILPEILSEAAKEYGTMSLTLDDLINLTQEEYQKSGETLTPEDAYKEVIAQAIADKLFTDPELIDRLCKEKPSLGQRILNFIKDALRWITGKERLTLIRAERLYEQALWGNEGRSDGGTQLAISSKNSNLVGSEMLEKEKKSFGIDDPNDYIHVQKRVYETLQKEGFFEDDNGSSLWVVNDETGMKIRIDRKGIKETFNQKIYGQNSKKVKALKLATIRMISDVIKTGRVFSKSPNTHNSKSTATYIYIEKQVDTQYGAVTIHADIRVSPKGNRFWVHRVDAKGKSHQGSTSAQEKTLSGIQTLGGKERISQSSESVNPQFEKNQQKSIGASEGSFSARIGKMASKSESYRVSRLREVNQYLKEEMKRTKGNHKDPKEIRKLAETLTRMYASETNPLELAKDLTEVYDAMANDGDWNEIQQMANKTAENLLRNTLENDSSEGYTEMQSYLEDAVSGKIAVDEAFAHLSEEYPEIFDAAIATSKDEQIELMEDVLSLTKEGISDSLSEAADYLSADILSRYSELSDKSPTYADKQKRQLDKLRAEKNDRIQKIKEESRQKLRDAVSKARADRDRKIEALKEKYRGKTKEDRERREAAALRKKIERHAQDLSKKLLTPNSTQHVPEELRSAVALLLDSINRESHFSIDPETGKPRHDATGDPNKRTEAFRALRDKYEEILNAESGGNNMVIDPNLLQMIKDVEKFRDTRIADMDPEQLTVIWEVIKAVEASISSANKALAVENYQRISDIADRVRQEIKTNRERKEYGKVLGKLDELINFDMITPQAFFHRLGSAGDSIFKALRNAQDQQIRIIAESESRAKKILGKTDVKKLESDTKTIQLSRGKITISVAQIMSLYELVKREQARKHLYSEAGGLRVEEILPSGKVKKTVMKAPVTVTREDVEKILGTLSEDQKKLADKIQREMGDYLEKFGNETSLAVYGYRKFTTKDYFPINSDPNRVRFDVANAAVSATVAGMGMAQSTNEKASNPLMVRSIFDVYAQHTTDMATYAAWLPVLEDLKRFQNFTFRDDTSVESFRTVLDKTLGEGSIKYIQKLTADLQNGIQAKDRGMFDSLLGNYKASTVGANIRVIVQQPTSGIRAMAVINPKYFISGPFNIRKTWETVRKYAPIAIWKDFGYFDVNTGRQMRDVLLGTDSNVAKLNEALMKGASLADSITWAQIWKACEAEVKDTRNDLTPDTDAFYKVVAERFNEVIDKTQVVDGVLQRSQVMRSTNAAAKMATSFMSEPTKTFGMLYNAVYDLNHAKGEKAKKSARVIVARTAAALTVQLVVNALVVSLVDAMRDDDREKGYLEKVGVAFLGISGDEKSFQEGLAAFLEGNLFSNFNPLTYIPYVKDVYSVVQGYDANRMDMAVISSMWRSAQNLWKSITGESKKAVPDAVLDFLAESARLFGLSVANIKRDVFAFVNTVVGEIGDPVIQYHYDKLFYSVQKNKSRYLDLLYQAMQTDLDAYTIIYDDLLKNGMDEKEIQSGLNSRIETPEGWDVELTEDSDFEGISPDVYPEYVAEASEMISLAYDEILAMDLSEEGAQKLYKEAKSLVKSTLQREYKGKKYTGYSFARLAGVSAVQFLWAKEAADTDGNGSIKDSEAQDFLKTASELSQEQKAAVYYALTKAKSRPFGRYDPPENPLYTGEEEQAKPKVTVDTTKFDFAKEYYQNLYGTN